MFRLVSRQRLGQFRQFHKCLAQQAETSAATASTVQAAPPSSVDDPVDPKIDKIANDITALNLIEVAELSDLLKKRLNLPDAPIMPMGGFAAASVEEVEKEPPKKVQTSFSVKLMAFDEKQKIALIKEVKNQMPDTNLVQAKKFVESAPIIVQADMSKEDAEKLKEAFVKVGATIEIV
ncbi:PREDICTED: 39S ribosomal protein L12, mitochondrial [Dinoponera quadriceps]|uniref:39S ribosomal protein L12, mitochondrial n=1 Tax=Dinoponera quadriceps TaxID=609295 RepID=A0A6P3XEC5_DINQU|nr:PREDICTED: 39S ribosomal protein L12, mitochondrial [Dinoponera quadriceps]